MPYVLVNLDITQEILHEYRPQRVTLRDVKVTVHIPDDRKIVENAMKDPLLHHKMVDTVQRLVRTDLAKLMAFQLSAADINVNDALVAGNVSQAAAAAASVERRLAETEKQIIPKIESAAGQVWKDLTRTKKEYNGYLVKCGIKIVGSAVSTGLSVAAIASAPVLAIGLLKAAKDALELLRNLRSAAVEAETMGAEVQKTLDTLATRFKDPSKAKAAAWEAAHAVFDPIHTPEKAKEQNETYGSKLQGLEVSSHKAAEALNDLLVKSEALRKAISAMPKPAPGSPAAKDALALERKRNDGLTKLETTVNERIQKIISLGARVKDGQRRQKDFAAAIVGFQKKTPTWVPGALKAINFLKDVNPIELAGGALKLKEAGDALTDAALAIADTFGDDVVDKVVGEEERAASAPPGPAISSPRLASTTANLGAMKLTPIAPTSGAPKK